MRTSNLPAFLGQMITAAVAAVVVSVVALTAIARVEWPAFPSSNQLHALTTVGQVSCLHTGESRISEGFNRKKCKMQNAYH